MLMRDRSAALFFFSHRSLPLSPLSPLVLYPSNTPHAFQDSSSLACISTRPPVIVLSEQTSKIQE